MSMDISDNTIHTTKGKVFDNNVPLGAMMSLEETYQIDNLMTRTLNQESDLSVNTSYEIPIMARSKSSSDLVQLSNSFEHHLSSSDIYPKPTYTGKKVPLNPKNRTDASPVNICSNCKATETSLWRKHKPDNSILCNACSLFYKLNQSMRPPCMKNDVVRRRNRKKKDVSAGTKLAYMNIFY